MSFHRLSIYIDVLLCGSTCTILHFGFGKMISRKIHNHRVVLQYKCVDRLSNGQIVKMINTNCVIIGSFCSMSVYMLFQILSLWKWFTTSCTRIKFFSGVSPDVVFQSGSARKCFVTNQAIIRTFSRVNPHMHFQILKCWKYVISNSASIRLSFTWYFQIRLRFFELWNKCVGICTKYVL